MIYMKQNYVEIVREVNFKTNNFRNQASSHQESKYLELRNIPLSYQKIKFECTLAFDRQRATSVILHFLIVPRLYIVIDFLTDFLIFTSNPTIMTELMTLYDLGLHVFARWVDKLPATC